MILRERHRELSKTVSDPKAKSRSKAFVTDKPEQTTLDSTGPRVEMELVKHDELPRSTPVDLPKLPTQSDGAAGDDRPGFLRHIARMKLLKIRHHVNFLDACVNDDLLPKGMSLRLRVNVMEPTDDLPSEVNKILTKASTAIRDLVANHYRKLQRDYEANLADNEAPPLDDGKLQQELEDKEADFATRLADRRGRKLEALRHPERQRDDRRPRPPGRPNKTDNGRRRHQQRRNGASRHQQTRSDVKQGTAVPNPPASNSRTHAMHAPTTHAPNDYARTNPNDAHTNPLPSRPSFPPPPLPPPPPVSQSSLSRPPPPVTSGLPLAKSQPPPNFVCPPPPPSYYPSSPPFYPPQGFLLGSPPGPPPSGWSQWPPTCFQPHPFGSSGGYWQSEPRHPGPAPPVNYWTHHPPTQPLPASANPPHPGAGHTVIGPQWNRTGRTQLPALHPVSQGWA